MYACETKVSFSHVVTSLCRLKAKGPKTDSDMGSSQEYNVWNIFSQGANALPRLFSTLIPALKKINLLPHFVTDFFNIYDG